ncbi:hypothetical protein INT44_001763 [Umbelopsis vinacea]|uniref:Osmotin, thaumatin-like protein n=1 Tax=Umbelopsis vinacea TaxID=44442 RepID=A0A8H7UD61_9FUNG|nr:hypothetical protein INT44_001763 [Umbelopsis vinacea]
MRLFLTALVLLGLCLNVTVASKKLAFHNKCKQTVTAGLLGNGVQYYNLQHDQSHTVVLSNTWAGRAWGRYKCYNNKQRSNATQCGAPGTPNPASLAEFAFGAYAGLDFYDLSMVDGYNLPIKISPIGAKQGSNKYDCGSPTCSNLPQCPSTLTVKGSDGKLLGCQSDCSKYGGDKFCCGAGVKNCGGPYAPMIKKKCPSAYSKWKISSIEQSWS